MQQTCPVQNINEAQQNEERLFVATCYAASCSKEAWLVDSGYTQHMTHNSDFLEPWIGALFPK